MTPADRALTALLILFAGVGFVTVLVWAVTGLTRLMDKVDGETAIPENDGENARGS